MEVRKRQLVRVQRALLGLSVLGQPLLPTMDRTFQILAML